MLHQAARDIETDVWKARFVEAQREHSKSIHGVVLNAAHANTLFITATQLADHARAAALYVITVDIHVNNDALVLITNRATRADALLRDHLPVATVAALATRRIACHDALDLDRR